MNFIEWLQSNGQLLLSGAAGGVVRWLTLKQGWRDGGISVTVGSILAFYLGPYAVSWLKPVAHMTGVGADAAVGLGGFLVGMGGIVVSGFVIDLWQLRRKMVQQQTGERSDGSE